MSMFRPDNSEISASAERVAAGGGRLGKFSHMLHSLRGRLFGEPQYVPEYPMTIGQEADAAAALAASGSIRGPESLTGEVATARDLMLRQARENIDALHSVRPDPSTPEDLFLTK